jgi:hypothetical protein
MATQSWTEGGRQITIINRCNQTVGVCGLALGPYATTTVPLRKIQGHSSYMTELYNLKLKGKIDAQLNSDILDLVDLPVMDAPLSGEVWLTREVWNNVVTNDRDGIKASFTAPAANTTYSGTDLDGAYGTGDLDYARNITIYTVCGGGEATIEKDFVITGVDINGQVLVETITVAAVGGGANTTTQGVYAFKSITSVYVPLDSSGSPGAHEIGFGKKLGLKRPLTQGGMIAEFVGNAAAGAGTVALSTTGLPNGTYSPALDPNGARDWVVYYVAS